MCRNVVALAVAAALFGPATAIRSPCDAIAAGLQADVQNAITEFKASIGTIKARLNTADLALLGGSRKLAFLTTPIDEVGTVTQSFSDLFDGVTDKAIDGIAMPAGLSLTCEIDVDTNDLFLTLVAATSDSFSITESLDFLPAATKTKLGGLVFTEPNVALSGTVNVAATIEIDVGTSGFALRVSGVAATFSAAGAVNTQVTWAGVGSVAVAGNVDVTGVVVPVVFPTVTTIAEFKSSLGEIHVGTLAGALDAELHVTVGVSVAGQLPSPVLTFTDDNLFDSVVPKVTVDADISTMEETIIDLLSQLGEFDLNLADFGLGAVQIADVDVSKLLNGVTAMMNLAPVAEQYYMQFDEIAGYPTFKGLMAYVKQNLPLPQASTSLGIDGLTLTGGWFPESEEVALNLRFQLGASEALTPQDGSVKALIGDMDQLDSLFSLIGKSMGGSSLAVPDFQTGGVVFQADVVIDVTVGLKTSFINQNGLTGSALAGNAFFRVNDLSAHASVSIDPINIFMSIPLGSLTVRDGNFNLGLGIKADFANAVDEEDTSVTTVAAETEITLLRLATGGASAFVDFIKQLKMAIVGTLDIVMPIELTTAFTGDKSLLPIVELHELSIFTLGIPKMSLDIDLSILIPGLPGGIGGVGNEVEAMMSGKGLTGLINGISGLSLPSLSIPGISKVDSLLSGFLNKFDFVGILAEYTELLVAFRQLSGGLSLALELDSQSALTLVGTDTFNQAMLALFKDDFPTTFADFDAGVGGLFNSSKLTQKFDVRNYLQHFQTVFGISNTLASASAQWTELDLDYYLAVHAGYGLTKRTSRALIRLLGLSGFDAVDTEGFPWDGVKRFDPADHLAAFQTALGFSGTITLGDLSAKLGAAVATFGANPDFQKKVYAMLNVRFPALLTAYSGTSLTGVAIDPLTGKEFNFADFLPQVGELLGLGNAITLTDLKELFAERPTIQGLVKFLKNRVLKGLALDLTLGPLTFGGGLTTTPTAMELAAKIGIAFSATLKPTEVVTMIKSSIEKLLEKMGEGGVVDQLTTTNALAPLAAMDQYMTFSADFTLRVEVGLDIKPLVEQTGTKLPKLFVRVLEFSMEAGAVVAAFPTDMNFGANLDFQLVADAEMRFAVTSSATDAAPLVLVDQGTQQTTGLVDRITDSLTVEGTLDVNLKLTGTPLAGITVFVLVEDTNLFDSTLPKFTVDIELSKQMVDVLQVGLEKAGDIGRFINNENALRTTIPLLGRSLQDMLKVNGAGPDWGDFFIWDTFFNEIAATYPNCATGGDCPRAKEIVNRFKTEMKAMTTDTFRAVKGVAPFFVNGGKIDKEFHFNFALNGGFSMAVTPPLADLIEDEDFDFTVNSELVVNIGFALGIDIIVDISGGLSSVTSNDIKVRVNDFKLTADVAASVTATAKIGIIEASINGGTGNLAAAFEAQLNGKALTPLSTLSSADFTFLKSATLDACLPFSASVGSTSLTATDDDANGPRICVTDSDLFTAPAPAVQTYNMKKMIDFKGMTPVQMMGMLRGLLNIITEYREQPVFDIPVPFTDVDVGDVLDFANEFSAKLLSKMLKVQDAKDRDTLELCLDSAVFVDLWNTVDLTAEPASPYVTFQAHLVDKEIGVILNNEQEFPLNLDEATLKAATSVAEIVAHISQKIFAAGLSESLRVEQVMTTDAVPVAVDQIRFCTTTAVRATDLQLTVRVKKTATKSAKDGDAVPTLLGYQHGATKEAPRVPAFTNFQEMLDLLAKATGKTLGITYTYDPTPGNPSTTDLLFAIQLTLDLPTPSVELAFGAEVDPLLEVYAAADISLTSAVTFDFEFGARMGLGAPELRVVGQVPSKDLEVLTPSELVIKVVLDKKSHTVTLRKDKGFLTELKEKLGELTASGELAAGVTFTAESFTSPDDGRTQAQKIVSVILKTTGVKVFKVEVDAATTALSGLGNENVKATLFSPIFKGLKFAADITLAVQNLELAATLAVLEARAYNGMGTIGLVLNAEFAKPGEPGVAMTLSEFAGYIMTEPFDVITATGTLGASAEISAEVTVPGLSLAAGADAKVTLADFTVIVTKNNIQKLLPSTDASGNLVYIANPNYVAAALPQASDFVFDLTLPTLPNLANIRDMSIEQIINMVKDGVELLFGKPGDATETGLIGNFPFLDTEIPLVSFSPKQAIQWIQTKLELLSAALADPGAGIKAVEKIVEKTLGIWPANDVNEVKPNGDECYGSCFLEFTYDSAANQLGFVLEYRLGVPTVTNVQAGAGDSSGINLALNLDLFDLIGLAGITMTAAQEKLLGDFIDLEASMEFAFDGAAVATLEMFLDMSAGGVPVPHVGQNTGFRLEMKASATADLSMSLGPLTFEITDGSVVFDDGAGGFAYVNFGLDADYSLAGLVGTSAERSAAISSIVSGFGLTYAGQLDVKLPITSPALAPPEAPLWLRIPNFGDIITNKVTGTPKVTFPVGGTDFKTLLESMLGGIAVNPIKALLADSKALIKGLRNIFTKVNLVVAGAEGILGGLNVPIIGQKLTDLVNSNFLNSFQEGLISEITTALANLGVGDDTSVASALHGVMKTFFKGLGLLLECDAGAESCPYTGDNPKVQLFEAGSAGNPAVVSEALNPDGTYLPGFDMDPLESVDAIQFDLVLGFNKVFSEGFGVDLGIEGLPLDFTIDPSATIKLEMGWHLKLRFGMSLSKGLYLDVQGDDDLSVYATLSFESLTGFGRLGFLGASITNKDTITALSGSLVVDIKEPDGDGKLTFPELKKGAKGLLALTAAFDFAAGFDVTLGISTGGGTTVAGMPEFLASFFTYQSFQKVIASSSGVTSVLTPAPTTVTPPPTPMPPTTPAPEDYNAEGLSGAVLILDVGLKLGKFVQNMLSPIFTKLDEFLGPFKPILDALTAPLPVVSDIAGRDVSLMELPEMLINGLLGSGGPVRGSVKNVLAYLNAIKEILELVIVVVDAIAQIAADLAAGNDIIIDFGNWKVNGGVARWEGYIPAGYKSPAHTPHVLGATSDSEVPAGAKNGGGKGGAMADLFARLTDSNSIFNLPFLSPSGVMNIITGEDVDLFVVNTPRMEVDVTIDFWFPVAFVVIIDFYGSFKFKAGISVGYDTSGIRSAMSSGDWTEAINGFFISDTDVPTGIGGNDIPELYSAGIVRIGGTLNVGLAKLSGSGYLSFEGSIDLFDPNNDGKIRLSEIISIIKEDGFLALFNIKIKMCAGISLAVELFNPFVNWKCKWYGCWPHGRWESIWKMKASSCFLNIDTTPAPLPILGENVATTLTLNAGSRASKRVSGDTKDGPEHFTIKHIEGVSPTAKIVVKFGKTPASGKEDNRATEEHTGVSEYAANGGSLGDTFTLIAPAVGGAFVGGNGGTDRLILDFTTVTGTIPPGVVANSGDTGSISGFGLGAPITFKQFEEVYIKTNGGADDVSVTGLHADTKLILELGDGNDRVAVTTGPTDGPVQVSGTAGRDLLTLRAGTTSSTDGKATDSKVTGLGMTHGVTFSSVEILRVELSTGSDSFRVESTATGCKVDVLAMGDAKDTITVGSAFVGLAHIRSHLTVTGDSKALSELIATDEPTTTARTGSLEAGRVLGLGMYQDGLLYYNFEKITVKTSLTHAATFGVTSTHLGRTFVYTGGAADKVTVSGVQGVTKIYTGVGEDTIAVPVVVTVDEEKKRLGAHLLLDGGDGNDKYNIGMSGKGTSIIQLSDSGWNDGGPAELNKLEIYGTPSDDTFLFRKNFIALIHAGADAERLDMDGSINGGIRVYGYEGDDTFATDGTAGRVEQFGGKGDDVFLVGQLYNSERVVGKVGSAADVFDTTETTRGFLSDGNNKDMSCYGESGKDSFVVMRNVGALSLSGGVGNDRFTVRSFALQREEDKVNPDKQQKATDVRTDEGDDTVYYAINAPVAVDGGPGFDTLVAIGTELNDQYVVTRDGIFGAGRHTAFIGIESVELATDAGDDAIYVMSTASEVKTSIFAGLGSDTIWITPRYSVPVSAQDLRGHNGIVEHAVSSADGSYDELQAHGVTVYVADEDAPEVVLKTVSQHEMVIEEFSFTGLTSYSEYTVVLSKPVTTDDVFVILGTPGGSSEIPGSESIKVGKKSTWAETLTFNSGNWNVPQTVSVQGLPDGANEGKSVPMIGHSIEQHGALTAGSDGYNNLVANMMPVTLIDSDQAEVYIVKPQEKHGVRIAEQVGGTGTVDRTISYDVVLRPCVSQSSAVTITVNHDAQVTVDKTSLSFNTGNKCKQTVTVTAVNDGDVEGFHFASLSHTVSGTNRVFKSSLEAGYINIEILDNDAPTMAVLESNGATEVLESGTYDTYDVYLTKAPTADVTVDVNVLKSQVYGNAAAARKQVRTEPASLKFTAGNYNKIQTVKVYAIIDDTIDLGDTTQLFASQPALAYQIQGSLTVGGGESPDGSSLLKPVVFPGETDIAAYPGPVSPSLSVLEDQQTDRLVLENSGGILPTNVQLITTKLADGKSVARITGMGMGVDRTLAGETIFGGVTYYDFEEVVLNLGPAADTVTVDGTHAGATYVNGGTGVDTFNVKSTDGPVYLSGDRDADTFNVGSDANSVQHIKDLVAVLGGTEVDVLNVRGVGLSDAGVLTRTEMTGMGMVGVSAHPVQALSVRGTGGSFIVSFSVTLTQGGTPTDYVLMFAHGVSAADMKARLQVEVFPADTCGSKQESSCSPSFAVDKLGDTYLVRYMGEVVGGDATITAMALDTTMLVNRQVELYQGASIDSRKLAAGIAYGDIESLNIELSSGNDAFNVRGTSIPTVLKTGLGDDTVAVGSDTNLPNAHAANVEVFGRLDYIEATLTVDGGSSGKNRLMITDTATTSGRTLELTSGLVKGAPADIVYMGADFTRGIMLWMGNQRDVVHVKSTFGVDGATRTVTSLFTGGGNDEVTVALAAGTDGFFVVGTQSGDDTIDATASTLPLVLVGGTGKDTIKAGKADDIIFGDEGYVSFGAVRLGDTTDTNTEFDVPVGPPSVATSTGCTSTTFGNDIITSTGGSSDIIIGGLGDDVITSDSGSDIVLGDEGFVVFGDGKPTKIHSRCPSAGGMDTIVTNSGNDIVLGGSDVDKITTAAGRDFVIGDHGVVLLSHVAGVRLVYDARSAEFATGADDVLRTGADEDVVFGGMGKDKVWAGSGDDLVFGDAGFYTATADGTYVYGTLQAGLATLGQDVDELRGEDGGDRLIGGQGADKIWGGNNNDIIFGDSGKGTVNPTSSVDESEEATYGDVDILEGENDDDVLFGGLGANILRGGSGNDVLFGQYGKVTLNPTLREFESTFTSVSTDKNTIWGGIGNDVAFGGFGADEIHGEVGRDTLFGDHGKVTFSPTGETAQSIACADGGADTINGNADSDFIFGGAGEDKIWGNVAAGGDASGDVIFGDHGKMVLETTSGVVTFESTCTTDPAVGAKDTIVADMANDFVFGGQGSDTVHGNAGEDVIFGDFGKVVLTPASTLSVYETTSPADGAGDFLYSHGGNDYVFGGAGGDEISAGEEKDVVFGDSGKVTINVNAKTRKYESTNCADGGADTINGNVHSDYIFGGVGKDKIWGDVAASSNTDADVMFGDHGTVEIVDTVSTYTATCPTDGDMDTIVGADGGDTVYGGLHRDTVHGNAGDDVVFGDFGKTVIDSSAGTTVHESISPAEGSSDDIYTHAGDDTIFGGVGGDTIESGTDDDIVFGDHGKVELSGTTVTLTSIFTTVTQHGGNDNILALAGNDEVFGGQGTDTINTNEGDDIVFGDFGKTTKTRATGAVVRESISPVDGSNDFIYTHAGDDTIFGGVGGDTIESGTDNDVVFGDHGKLDIGSLAVIRESIFTTVPAEGGNDNILALAGNDKIFGGQGTDTINTNEGDDIVFGDFGKIKVQASDSSVRSESISPADGSNDFIYTHAGDDTIFGGVGGDTIESGTDNDVVFGDHGEALLGKFGIFHNSAFTTVPAEGGNDNILALAGNDKIFGGQGTDTINTNEGDDIVFGDFGNSRLLYSDGSYLHSSVSPADGARDIIFTHGDKDLVFGGIGDDYIESGTEDDIVFGDHGKVWGKGWRVKRESTDTTAAQGGDDTIIALAGNDQIFGGQGTDTINTNEGDDVVFGDFGEIYKISAVQWRHQSTSPADGALDKIYTHAGNDKVFGGVGGDVIESGTDDDLVFGDHGRADETASSLHAYSISTTVPAEGGDDNILALSGNDHVFGGQGFDRIHTNEGNDVVFGDFGTMTLDKSNGDAHYASTSPAEGSHDFIYTYAGDDTVFGGVGSDKIESGTDDDVVFGDHGEITRTSAKVTLTSIFTTVPAEGGNDNILALSGNDKIFGGQTTDTINTNEGDDIVFGDFGKITVEAGVSSTYESISPADGALDKIYTHAGDDTIFGGVGGDTIESGTDKDVVFGDHGKIVLTPVTRSFSSLYHDVQPNDGADNIQAGSENDMVFGGNARDTIKGDEGDDWIFGDHGEVTQTGTRVCLGGDVRIFLFLFPVSFQFNIQCVYTHSLCSARSRRPSVTSTRLRATSTTTTSSAALPATSSTAAATTTSSTATTPVLSSTACAPLSPSTASSGAAATTPSTAAWATTASPGSRARTPSTATRALTSSTETRPPSRWRGRRTRSSTRSPRTP